ncbi:HTH_Tnp_Tc3_2 domain-containing protein [Trichonephila clavipes]|nr:HTH_Tnp_Tc3_2 domain-containing protein [Trichonephila clavipes]
MSELIGGWSRGLLCFRIKAGSSLVSMRAMWWSEEGQGNACSQTSCYLDTLDLHLESCSGGQFPMKAGAPLWLFQTHAVHVCNMFSMVVTGEWLLPSLLETQDLMFSVRERSKERAGKSNIQKPSVTR